MTQKKKSIPKLIILMVRPRITPLSRTTLRALRFEPTPSLLLLLQLQPAVSGSTKTSCPEPRRTQFAVSKFEQRLVASVTFGPFLAVFVEHAIEPVNQQDCTNLDQDKYAMR